MVVQHNLQAMNASRMLGITTGSQEKATEKLSCFYMKDDCTFKKSVLR